MIVTQASLAMQTKSGAVRSFCAILTAIKRGLREFCKLPMKRELLLEQRNHRRALGALSASLVLACRRLCPGEDMSSGSCPTGSRVAHRICSARIGHFFRSCCTSLFGEYHNTIRYLLKGLYTTAQQKSPGLSQGTGCLRQSGFKPFNRC